MANFTYSGLQAHPIFNEFDSHGLLLALPRITEERNAEYKHRLLDVYVNPANSTHQGLINGITRELGLALIDTLTIANVLDGDGNPVEPFPATIFEDTKCYLYSDYPNRTILKTIDRYDIDGSAYTLSELEVEINATGTFTATLASGLQVNTRSMTIWNQTSVPIVLDEHLGDKGHRIKLENRNLVIDTVSVQSNNLLRRVDTENDLEISGDYYIDLPNGLVISHSVPVTGSIIRYQYRDDSYTFKSSPVILHNLQSDDFKTKMFEQRLDEDNNTVNGAPTVTGANIINELLSVFPSNWSK